MSLPISPNILSLLANQRFVSQYDSGQNGHTQQVTNAATGDSIAYNSATQTQYSGTQQSYSATINGLTTSTYENGALKESLANGNSIVAEHGVLYGADANGNRTALGLAHDPDALKAAVQAGYTTQQGANNFREAQLGGLGAVDGVAQEFPNAGAHIGPGAQQSGSPTGLGNLGQNGSFGSVDAAQNALNALDNAATQIQLGSNAQQPISFAQGVSSLGGNGQSQSSAAALSALDNAIYQSSATANMPQISAAQTAQGIASLGSNAGYSTPTGQISNADLQSIEAQDNAKDLAYAAIGMLMQQQQH